MNPRRNPFAPGAGIPPPELAGRDDLTERAAIALDRIRARAAARSLIFYGLRGVGKTVLLNRVRQDAEGRAIFAARMEAPEDRSSRRAGAEPACVADTIEPRRRCKGGGTAGSEGPLGLRESA